MALSNRREFLQASLAAAAVAALPAGAWAADGTAAPAAAATKVHPAKQVLELGPAKIRVSRMAMGTGTYGAGNSSNQLRNLGADGLGDLLTRAYENGVFFWDSSDSYGTHAGIKSALKRNKVPREKVTILTKTPAVSAAELKQDLDRFREELGTDYIDIILLHSRTEGNWTTEDKPLMDVLSEAKEKKIVRSVGASIHSLEALQAAGKSKWVEVCMARLNPGGIRMDATPEEVLPVLQEVRKAGKGIVQIKVLGEGELIDRIDEALTYALTKSPAHCFSIGSESLEDFKDNMARLEKLGNKL